MPSSSSCLLSQLQVIPNGVQANADGDEGEEGPRKP